MPRTSLSRDADTRPALLAGCGCSRRACASIRSRAGCLCVERSHGIRFLVMLPRCPIGGVKAAVLAQLEAKGCEQAADKPECRIAYHMTTREIPKAKPSVGVGVGGGSRGMGGGIGVSVPIGRRPAFTGTFTLDVIDAAKNAQVWADPSMPSSRELSCRMRTRSGCEGSALRIP